MHSVTDSLRNDSDSNRHNSAIFPIVENKCFIVYVIKHTKLMSLSENLFWLLFVMYNWSNLIYCQAELKITIVAVESLAVLTAVYQESLQSTALIALFLQNFHASPARACRLNDKQRVWILGTVMAKNHQIWFETFISCL